MSAIRVVVVDDEPLARRRIVRLLEGREEFELAGEFDSGRKAALAIPESYRGAHVLKAEHEMWAGVASDDKDPRTSLHVGDVPTPAKS